jgi:hypothetical protein
MSNEPIAASGRFADCLIDPLFSNALTTRLRSRRQMLLGLL